MTIQTVPEQRKLVVVQRNPTSGSGRGRRAVWNLFRGLRSKGFDVRVYHCRARFSRFVQRSDVANRLRCLVAAGGDGTISSVVQRHPQHPIAVLPLGTENLVAKHLGMSTDGEKLATVIQNGCYLPFDTGLAGSFRFLLMASVGMDAEVVRLLAASRTGNISHLSYLKPLLNAFRQYTFPELHVVDENGQLLAVGSHVIVANMAEYGMKIPFCHNASPHDGLLDVRVFRKSGVLRTALHLLKTKLGGRDSADSVVRFRAARLSVTCSDTDVPLQADGDPCGTGGTEFRIANEKMHLMVPSDFQPKQSCK